MENALPSVLRLFLKTAFIAIQESLISQVSELPLTINVVAREKEIIEEVLHANWWSTPTGEKLHLLIERLAPLHLSTHK